MDLDPDQKLAKTFFTKILRSPIFNIKTLPFISSIKVRKKFAIYEDLEQIVCVYVVSLPHAGEHKVHIRYLEYHSICPIVGIGNRSAKILTNIIFVQIFTSLLDRIWWATATAAHATVPLKEQFRGILL